MTSIAGIIGAWALCQPDRIALHFEGSDTTWRRFWNRIERATARLQGEWHVKPGERVAYLGLNRPEELILLFALARLGAILLPLNTRLLEQEWHAIVRHAGARLVLADVSLESEGLSLALDLGLAFHELDSLIEQPCPRQPILDDVSGASPVLLVYTSCASGQPKGVLHSQDGLLWNASAAIAAHDLTSRDHVLTALPLYHTGGLCIQTLPALFAGASVTLHRRFEAGAWLGAIAASRPTLSLMVPATFLAVEEHPDFARVDLSCLRLVMAGSSTIARPLLEAFHARGVPVGQVYGSTETGPVSIVLRAEKALTKVGYAGWPALHTEIRLVDEQGKEIEGNAVGEIWIRARHMMLGYWESDGATVPAPVWFKSGDLARRDQEGCYEIVGRAGDLILSGSENVYPAEIENILTQHPSIAEAAVMGTAHARWGEAPIAAVVLHPGTAVSEADILGSLEGRLACYKWPYRVFIVGNLPRNAVGKVNKVELARVLQPLLQDEKSV